MRVTSKLIPVGSSRQGLTRGLSYVMNISDILNPQEKKAPVPSSNQRRHVMGISDILNPQQEALVPPSAGPSAAMNISDILNPREEEAPVPPSARLSAAMNISDILNPQEEEVPVPPSAGSSAAMNISDILNSREEEAPVRRSVRLSSTVNNSDVPEPQEDEASVPRSSQPNTNRTSLLSPPHKRYGKRRANPGPEQLCLPHRTDASTRLPASLRRKCTICEWNRIDECREVGKCVNKNCGKRAGEKSQLCDMHLAWIKQDREALKARRQTAGRGDSRANSVSQASFTSHRSSSEQQERRTLEQSSAIDSSPAVSNGSSPGGGTEEASYSDRGSSSIRGTPGPDVITGRIEGLPSESTAADGESHGIYESTGIELYDPSSNSLSLNIWPDFDQHAPAHPLCLQSASPDSLLSSDSEYSSNNEDELDMLEIVEPSASTKGLLRQRVLSYVPDTRPKKASLSQICAPAPGSADYFASRGCLSEWWT